MVNAVLILVAGVLSIQTAPAGPPIFHPGAPGQAARVVTPAQAVALGRTSFTAADVAFMQHMLVHHAQAVEMVELLKTRGADEAVGRLGLRIAMGQEAEMALMRDWLAQRGQAEAMAGASHAGHAGMDHVMHGGAGGGMAADLDVAAMPGMLTPRQMQTLAAAEGTAFDRLFLSGMIQHHQGALDMVETLLAAPNAAQDPMLSDFSTSVVADQSSEILRMQSLLSGLAPSVGDTASPSSPSHSSYPHPPQEQP